MSKDLEWGAEAPVGGALRRRAGKRRGRGAAKAGEADAGRRCAEADAGRRPGRTSRVP